MRFFHNFLIPRPQSVFNGPITIKIISDFSELLSLKMFIIQKLFFYPGRLMARAPVLMLLATLFLPATGRAQLSDKIAVLPFKVYAPEPLEHLVFGLQEMVTARLAKEGFDVMDSASVNRSELAGIGISDSDVVRRAGKTLKINWIIMGTLTRIGEKISIDLRCIPAGHEKRPFSIFVVAERLDTLSAAIERATRILRNRLKGVLLIGEISVEGNKRIETDAILASIESQKGMSYDPSSLDRDLRSIDEMGFFEDVQIDVEDGPSGKVVAFKVIEKPSIGKITFEGNKKIERTDLMEVIGVTKYSILNRKAVKDSVERLRDHYHQEGYYNVEIKEKIRDLPSNEVALVYKIKEGEKVYIKNIEFIGNATVDEDDLKDVMQISEKGFFSFMTDSGQLDRKKLESDILKIKAFYHNHGYIKARVGEPEISYEKDLGLKIKITISEGSQYSIGKVSLEGDLIKGFDELYQVLKIPQEEFYSREIVRSDILSLSEIYSDEGYAFVDIAPKIKQDDTAHSVDITYRISRGKKVKFERILVTGNNKTRDKVIRRELKVIEGGYFSGRGLKRSTQNLHQLGFFEDIQIKTKEGSTDRDMILTIDVKERATGMFAIGAGYSSVEKAMSSLSTRYTLSFTEPWLFGKPLSGGIELYNWEYEWDEFTKDSYGGRLKFGFPLGLDFTKGAITYTYDDAEVSDVSETASSIIKDMEGKNLTSSLTFGVLRDSRDKRFNAREGSANSLSAEYAGGFLGGDNYFTKYRARSAWFFPFFWDTAFSVQGKWGYVTQRSGGKLPVYEKFRLGGMTTVRGFDHGSISPVDPVTGDRIGGEKMMVYNLEFRVPLFKEEGIVGVLFYDAGNVFTEDEDYTFSGIRRSAGLGVRWYSPVGPLRLEWGHNLDQRPGEASSNWEFTMGTPF